MKFDSILDYKLMIRRVEPDIKDKEFLLRIKASTGEIVDADYFLLSDDVSSYIKELKHHSDKKTFYKKLLKKELVFDNISNLYSFMTHLSLGLNARKKVRKLVDVKDFKQLRDCVNKMVTSLLNDGKCDNVLYDLLN